MEVVETNKTYICDMCKRELTSLEYDRSAKMGITLSIPSKKGHCSDYTGIGKLDICEDCITDFGFIYDDPYVGSHIRMNNKLKSVWIDIINKIKPKLKFEKDKE